MRFHYPALIWSLFFLFLVLISCDTTPRGRLYITGPNTPTLEYVEDFFPLTVESSWTYQTSNRSVFLDTTFVDTIQYTNLEETDFAGYPSVAREARSQLPSTSYYTVIGDSLYQWEYDHWSTVFPESSLPNRHPGDTLDYSLNNIFATLWTLERTDSTVVLPIGTFHYCFYVKFQRFYVPEEDLTNTIECLIKPGVGTLVKRSILFGATPADTQSV
ncbi:MAG: hypothetical protein V2A56_03355, partial [bacterium]